MEFRPRHSTAILMTSIKKIAMLADIKIGKLTASYLHNHSSDNNILYVPVLFVWAILKINMESK